MPEKKRVTASRSPKEYISYVVDFVLRTLLTFNINKQLILYATIVTGLSIFTDIQRPGPSYFSNKNNVLNQYFVKQGWGWTLIAVTTLQLITSLIKYKGEIKNISQSVLRLIILTLYWYICTHSFEWLENFTGSCTNTTLLLKRPCLREGYNWLGFDISGHCFLLIFSLTIFNEEAQVLHHVSKRLDDIERAKDNRSTENSLLSPNAYRVLLRLSMLLMMLLTVIWLVMLVATSLYFHTTAQKVLGMLVAVIGWFLVYKIFNLGEGVH